MIVVYEGQSYPFDMDGITVRQGMAIEKHTGLAFADWGAAVEKGGNLTVMQALGWLILQGGNLDVPIADTDFKMAKLGEALASAMQAEAAAAEAAAGPRPTSGGSTAQPEANGALATDGPLSAASSGLT